MCNRFQHYQLHSISNLHHAPFKNILKVSFASYQSALHQALRRKVTKMKIEDFGPFKFARLGSDTIRDLSSSLDRLIAGRLWMKIILALILGILFGYLVGPGTGLVPKDIANLVVSWLAFPGQLFLSLIQLVIIPLVFASVVLGIVSSDSVRQLKTLGARIGIYYVFTTVVAVSIGFAVAFILKPGRFIDPSIIQLNQESSASPSADGELKIHSLHEVLTGLMPSNPFNALVSGEMLPIVLLAMFMGIALMSLKREDAKPIVDLLNSFQKISMTVIGWAMQIAPYAVFALTARLLAQLGVKALMGLGFYVMTILLGLSLVHVFYLLLVKFVAKSNPFTFLRKIRNVQLLAFSTSSSASVMPLTMETAEKELSVRPAISQFVVPLGATVNMDGTAMYQGVATIFLAQVFGIDLSIGQLALVVITATLSSIGAPGAPGVGMAILSVILANVGIPPSGIVIIMGVDRLLDMCRTVINVTGDLTAAMVMEKLSKPHSD